MVKDCPYIPTCSFPTSDKDYKDWCIKSFRKCPFHHEKVYNEEHSKIWEEAWTKDRVGHINRKNIEYPCIRRGVECKPRRIKEESKQVKNG